MMGWASMSVVCFSFVLCFVRQVIYFLKKMNIQNMGQLKR